MREQIWEALANEFDHVAVDIRSFLRNAQGSALTGSWVLQKFMDESWKSHDLDIFLPLTYANIKTFIAMITNWSENKFLLDLLEQNNLDNSPGLQGQGQAQTEDERPKKRPRLSQTSEPFDEYVSLVKNTKLPHVRRHPQAGHTSYKKHVRVLYYAITLRTLDVCIDVVFIPPEDLPTGSVFEWMKFNFDLNICANAVFDNGIKCFAPHYIAEGRALLRCDQYCHHPVISYKDDGNIDKDNMLILLTDRYKGANYSCNCGNILPNRIEKYSDRGFHIEIGYVRTVQ